MLNRKRVKANQNLYKQIWKLSNAVIKGLIKWFLRSLLVIGRRARLSRAGFVLPTVAMVGLVVVLLTTAILVRSFDRSKNASNVRVNQVVLNAAAPAVDRARAKIEDVLAKLAGKIPSDNDLNNYFTNKTYTLGDETPLELVFDIDKNNTIQKQPGTQYIIENDETINSAWKFSSDTDNNGKFDSYTLYGIYYRSPSRNTTDGNFNRARNPLEARTPPMSGGTLGGQCPSATGTSASFVGNSNWYKTGANLAKSFFVYTATVPITNLNPPTGYETYKGNKSSSALEFQQDRTRIPLINNAVVYEDDVELNPAPVFRLNGRLVTNGNLLFGNLTGNGVYLFQVSSPYSCYYQEENSKIVVGGNVAGGGILYGFSDQNYQPVSVHLFQGAGNPNGQDVISNTNRSTTNPSPLVSYNTQAYSQRLARLVAAQFANLSSTDPSDVKNQVNAAPASQQAQVRQTQLQIYFRNRTRRVPSFEVPYGGNALISISNGTATDYSTVSPLQGSGDTLRPIDAWIYPTDPIDGIRGTSYTGNGAGTDYTKLTLNINTSQQQAQLQATEPQTEKQNGKENYLGDRVQVGNNLPALWFNNGAFAGANTQQNLSGINWNTNPPTGPVARYRQTRVQALADLGITDRDGFWELAAAAKPTTQLDNNGGLRVITGAGVYERKYSFLPPPYYDNPTTAASEYSTTYDNPTTTAIELYPMVWPDSMPMSPGAGSQVYNNTSTITTPPPWTALPTPLPAVANPTIDLNTLQYAKGDLRMRATVVYHYAQSTYDPNTPANYQTPIACVSSYYDPTNSTTAANSNNGVVYQAPTNTASSITSVSGPNATTGLFSGDENSTNLQGRLYYQANLKFPNGRFVNETLRNALIAKANDSTHNFTLSEQSAIDSTICALQILAGTISPSNTFIPNGAIKEIAFLEARQIQAIDKDDPTTYPVETFTTDGNPTIPSGSANLTGNYDLSIEQRQPLEIRATVLDMNALRTQTIAGANVLAPSEYLLPNSGIIYASRDDALLDLSDKSINNDGSPNIQTRKLLSPTDFKLDPTRRPHSILLTNGRNLSRPQSFQAAEKGLILATNLPAYVNGDFNLHTQQEFTNLLANDWSNFYNRTTSQLNPNFACRQGDPRLPNCTQGDQWRTATVLADAVSLLSNNFMFGFRNDGDYDLRNNNGNLDSIKKQLNNGFWNNSFVTSRNFNDSIYSGNSGNTTNDSSYFNNFVTPIQRRVNNFPEYVMEICRKLPVSECQPNDWVVTISVTGDQKASNIPTGTLATQLLTGTTATAATNPADQRYARRVAFVRNTSDGTNTLQFTQIGTNAAAIPLGIDTNGKVAQFPYSSPTVPRQTQNNVLWFRTTQNTIGNPGSPTDITYANNNPLYYLPPNQGGNKVFLPDTPEILTVTSLNGNGTTEPSDYTICTNSSNSQLYQITSATAISGSCSSTNISGINAVGTQLLTLGGSLGTLTGNTQTLTAITTSNINVYKLPTTINSGAIISLNGNANSIFIFQGGNTVNFGPTGGASGITIKLSGVSPNNIFWVSSGSFAINDATNITNHQLIGNFLGTGSVKIGAYTKISGGRLLGFSTLSQAIPSTSNISAVPSNGEPTLVPVLQFQNTNGAPNTGSTDPNVGRTGNVLSTRWMMPAAATATTFNLAAAAGDSSTRVNPNTNTYESNGGIHNFVRFLENWQNNIPANISGSFIQLKRSAYATAPWSSVFLSIGGPGGIFNYSQLYNDAYQGFLPHYVAPIRQWGFDVALLSQSPDLFAQQLTLAPTSPPNEFFREVGRDDSWIQALLCAAKKDSTGNNYSSRAVDTDQLPTTGCPFTPPYP